MKKILLPGMMAALAFAACTNEEIVSQQTPEAPKADLSNRPVVGMVDLNFGPQTRATIGDNFNDIEWVPETDKIGARIIDNLTGNKTCHPEHNYEISDKYAWSNYRYDYQADEVWRSDALMVEGNYMFYAPYDETALYRENLKFTFPIDQYATGLVATKDYAKGGVGGNTSVIKNFYGNKKGHTVVVGHTFVSAKSGGLSVTPVMTQLYAYPLITVVNQYTEPVLDDKGDVKIEDGKEVTVPKEIEIDQITIQSSHIYEKYEILQQELVGALKLEVAAHNPNNDNDTNDEGAHAKENEGAWLKGGKIAYRTDGFLDKARTSVIAKFIDTEENEEAEIVDRDGKIIVHLNEPLTLQNGEGVKLNVVMPAETYDKGNFKVNVRVIVGKDKDGNSIYKKFDVSATPDDAQFEGDGYSDAFTYAVTKQIPNEEYNYMTDGTVAAKPNTWGTLATFVLDGELVDLEYQEVDPGNISSNELFYAWLEKITDNSTAKYEKMYEDGEEVNVPEVDRKGDFRLTATHNVKINKTFLENVEMYLKKASISFASDMVVEGGTEKAPLEIKSSKYPRFSGKLTIKKGSYVTIDGCKIGELVIEDGAFVTLKGAVETKISDVYGNVNLSGATLTPVDASKGIKFHGAPTLTDVTINGKANFVGKATITRGSYQDVTFNNGASLSGAITATDKTATVNAGAVAAGNTKGWAIVNLYGGSMEITNKAYAPEVNVGRAQNGNIAAVDGTLTANAADDNGNLTLPKVTLNTANSKLVVSKKLTIAAGGLTWTAGSIENNAELDYDLEVAEGNSYTHGKSAVVKSLENAGNVVNKGTLAVENTGTVTNYDAESRVTVTGTGGYVNNTALGIVINNGTQEVYINTGAFSNDDKYSKLDKSHAVNTLYINGKWAVDKDLTFTSPTGLTISKIVFQSGGSLALGSATFDFNDTPVVINSTQTWTGRLADVSIIASLSNLTFNAGTNGQAYTLTPVDINMGAEYAAAYSTAIQSAITAGNSVKLINDVELNGAALIVDAAEKNVTIDLNGKTLTHTATTGTSNGAIEVLAGNVTIKNGTIESTTPGDATTSTPAVWARGTEEATVVIENGTFSVTGENSCVYVSNPKATITIKGGTFDAGTNHKFTLNQTNSIEEQLIFVEGGTFVNFNPANAKNDDTWATGNANENINFVNANKVVSVYYGESLLLANTTTAYTETDWCTEGKTLTYKVVAKQ